MRFLIEGSETTWAGLKGWSLCGYVTSGHLTRRSSLTCRRHVSGERFQTREIKITGGLAQMSGMRWEENRERKVRQKPWQWHWCGINCLGFADLSEDPMCIVKSHCRPHGHEDRSFSSVLDRSWSRFFHHVWNAERRGWWWKTRNWKLWLAGSWKWAWIDAGHWTKHKSWKLFSMKSAIPNLRNEWLSLAWAEVKRTFLIG